MHTTVEKWPFCQLQTKTRKYTQRNFRCDCYGVFWKWRKGMYLKLCILRNLATNSWFDGSFIIANQKWRSICINTV